MTHIQKTAWFRYWFIYAKSDKQPACGYEKLTQGASILGLFVMGSLVSKWTTINIPLELSRYKNQMGEEVVTTVQSVLNDLLPGLAALLLTFFCMYLLRKKINTMYIIFALFGVGIVGYHFGILA